jgi:hypothetical protein
MNPAEMLPLSEIGYRGCELNLSLPRSCMRVVVYLGRESRVCGRWLVRQLSYLPAFPGQSYLPERRADKRARQRFKSIGEARPVGLTVCEYAAHDSHCA